MKIHRVILGDFQTNSYILTKDEAAKECIVIDTGMECGPLIDYLEQENLAPVVMLLTHGHVDHIVGLEVFFERFQDVKLAIHKADADMLTDPRQNVSYMLGFHFAHRPADIVLDDGMDLEYAGIHLKTIHVPGHTEGGLCYYSKEADSVFTGDTLFTGSIGRTDFPGGDFETLVSTIKDKLLVLPDETTVYPGHGPSSTIKAEKAHNQYLQG